jgi:hypothetical protein
VPPTATQVRGKLSKLERKTLSSLVVTDVHARDTVPEMANIHVTDDADFDWTSQVPPEPEPQQQSLTGRYTPNGVSAPYHFIWGTLCFACGLGPCRPDSTSLSCGI